MSKTEKPSLWDRFRGKAKTEKEQEEDAKAKHWAREWLDAFIWAAVAAIILRTFFFGAYRIPTPSMEKTLLTGDFLIVTKLAYGPRTPMTLSVPFTDIYVPGVNLPWFRIPGYSEIERDDIVVFNYPIDIAPVSAKTNYIKRAVGIPGDRIEIDNKILYVNGERSEEFESLMYNYRVMTRDRSRLSSSRIREAGGNVLNGNNGEYIINMTPGLAQDMEGWSEVDRVDKYILPEDFELFGRRGFNFSRGFNNHDHMEEFTVPYSGQEVELTADNWHLYQDILERYERNSVQRDGDSFVINGEETNRYTIQMDYYYMMGDNRDDSEDSRYWGFVPDNHIIGKAGIIYFSWDGERFLPRFERIFNMIH